jgi:hypothetical protein
MDTTFWADTNMTLMTRIRERAQRRLSADGWFGDDDRSASEPSSGRSGDGFGDGFLPTGLRIAGAWAWRLVGIMLVAYGLVVLIGALRIVVIPVVVALLLAALLEPAAALCAGTV